MTTFTRTWNASYEATPAGTDDASEGDDRIRDMKADVRERLEVDHSYAGDTDDGAHKKVTLIEQASDPANVANTGFVYTKDVSGATELFYEDDSGNIIQLTFKGAAGFPSNHIEGLVLSNGTDADHDIDIATGEAVDSGSSYVMKLTSGLTKQIDAIWAAGSAAGGFFSGAVAADTWYHVFLIRKDSDGTLDAGFDTSVSAANIPAGYTAYRRLGSVLTDSSANILGFSQDGDDFLLDSPPLDVNVTTLGTTAVSYTLSTPPDVKTTAKINAACVNSSAVVLVYLSSLDSDDLAPNASSAPLYSITSLTTVLTGGGQVFVKTNTSKQIRARATGASTTLRVATLGWKDPRGKN